MRAYFRLAVLFPALLFVLPVLAQKPSDLLEDKKDESKYKAKIYQQIAKTGKIACKITGLPEDLEAEEKVFEVQIDYEVKKPNPDGQKKYQEIYRQLIQAQRARDANRYKQLYKEAVAAAAGTYDVEKTPFTFKLVHGIASGEKKEKEKGDKEEKGGKAKGDKGEKGEKTSKTAKGSGPKELLVRREQLPPKDPDDPKVKYTPKELKELKGPGNYIGYQASLKDLENDMTVIIYVDKSKWKPPVASKKKKADDETMEEEDKPIPILMIMIPKPPPEPPGNPLLGGK